MPNKNNGLFKLSTIFFAMLPALLSGLNNKAQARDFFDPSFISSLNGSDPSTTPDLSVFQTQNAQAPGIIGSISCLMAATWIPGR